MHNTFPLLGAHTVPLFIKVAQVFDADTRCIYSFNTGRYCIYIPAHHYLPIGESGEVLCNFGKTAFLMSAFHALAKLEMITSVEVLVSRNISMMLLYQHYFPFNDLHFKPGIELRQVEQYKFSDRFHPIMN